MAFLLLTSVASADSPGFLGVAAQKTDTGAECVVVQKVYPGGPGDSSGIRAGDIILGVNSIPFDCTNLARGTALLPNVKVGERVDFDILRDGKTVKLTATAGDKPALVVDQDNDRKAKSDELLRKLAKSNSVLVVTRSEAGGLAYSGEFSADEAQILRWFFTQNKFEKFFEKSMTGNKLEMRINFDPSKGSLNFEPLKP